MSIQYKISKLVGNYNSLSFPVLGVLDIRKDSSFFVNDSYNKTFLSDHKEDLYEDIIKSQISTLADNPHIHHKGNIYKVDEFDKIQGVKYYFFTLSNESVSHSFLWLKHDLLNILNPIMGFSDVLFESEDIQKEDKVLIKKIKNNADKIYQQIQKLALLQSLESKHTVHTGSYEVVDFINELQNQLIAKQIFESISKTEITHQGKVNDRIIQSDFRSTLVEHLEYLVTFQNQKDLKIQSAYQKDSFIVKLILSDCNAPSNYMKMIEEVDQFLSECKAISKMQINAVNYLILNEICDSFGAKIIQRKIENDIIIEFVFPSISVEKEFKSIQKNTDIQTTYSTETKLFSNIPEHLYNNIRALLLNFDGLLILDEWQKLSNQLMFLNQKHKNEELHTVINDIQAGIQTFDVEGLRKIYHQCQQEFKI